VVIGSVQSHSTTPKAQLDDAHSLSFAGGWVSVGLLALAAEMAADDTAPARVDIHECLCAAAGVLAFAGGSAEAHRSADAAEMALVDFLVWSRLVARDEPGGALRTWLIGRSPWQVARGLRCAAGFYRLRLLVLELGSAGLCAMLLAEARGDGR
jgi:hypothetical protein